MTGINENLIQVEIKVRFHSSNACYHSIQNRQSSHLLSKYIKIHTYKTIILPIVLYGCEAWSKSRRMRWASHVARMGEKRNVYRLWVGKPEGKRPLGRPRYRWVDNIKMDLGEVGWGDVDWIGLTQDRNRWRALVNSVLNLRVP
jgi:hypothetical protein